MNPQKTIEDISNLLKAKLDLLVGENLPIGEVNDWHKHDLECFPAVTFELSDLASDYTTTCENDRRYVFRASVIQPIEESGRREGLFATYNAISAIINHIDDDYRLGGEVTKVSAVPAELITVKSQDGLIIQGELTIEVLIPYHIPHA